MGVPAFFKWLVKKYPRILSDPPPRDGPGEEGREGARPPAPQLPPPLAERAVVDNLYLDMNGIIHPCCHPEGKVQPKDEAEMIRNVFAYVDNIMNIVQPRRLLFMAIDGVAPRAKMNQQRARRFRSALEAHEKESLENRIRKTWEDEGRGHLLPPRKPRAWDSNVITPGTPFMAKLSQELHAYVAARLNSDPLWRGLNVIFSDARVPGEGEHKIMKFIRLQRTQPGYDANLRHCVYGMDADLIMLGLATHEARFSIFRETLASRNEMRCAICGQTGHQDFECKGEAAPADDAARLADFDAKKQSFQFLHVDILREYLAYDLRVPNLPFAWDLERVIDDWIFICFFCGNDFLPHLPSVSIHEGAIDRLVAYYKETLPTMGGYMCDRGQVNLTRAAILLERLGREEARILSERLRREEQNERSRKFAEDRRRQDAQQREQLKGQQQRDMDAMRPVKDAPAASPPPLPPPPPPPPKPPVLVPSEEQNRSAAALLRERLRGTKRTASEALGAGSPEPAPAPAPEAESEASPKRIKTDATAEAGAAAAAAAAPAASMADEAAAAAPAASPAPESAAAEPQPAADEAVAAASGAAQVTAAVGDEAAAAPAAAEVGEGGGEEEEEEEEEEEDAAAPAIKDEEEEEEEKEQRLLALKREESKVAPAVRFKIEMAAEKASLEARFAEEHKDEVQLGRDGWYQRYYRTKLGIDPEGERDKLEKLCRSYAEGLVWVFAYYYSGCVSWGWFFPYHYAPMARDMVNMDGFKIEFELGTPFSPFAQLMGVQPPASGHCLPAALRRLMTDKDSPILDFYPTRFEMDLNGKRHLWQAVVLLPFIDEARLLAAVASAEAELTPEERERNSPGHELLFVPAGGVLANDVCSLYLRNFARDHRERLDGSRPGAISGFLTPHPRGSLRMLDVRSEVGLPLLRRAAADWGLYTLPPDAPHITHVLPGTRPPAPVLNDNDREHIDWANSKIARGLNLPFRGSGFHDIRQRDEEISRLKDLNGRLRAPAHHTQHPPPYFGGYGPRGPAPQPFLANHQQQQLPQQQHLAAQPMQQGPQAFTQHFLHQLAQQQQQQQQQQRRPPPGPGSGFLPPSFYQRWPQ